MPSQLGSSSIELTTVEDIFELMRPSHPRWCDNLRGDWLFRGQSDVDWPLLPSLWRQIDRFEALLDCREVRSVARQSLGAIRKNQRNAILGNLTDCDIIELISRSILEYWLLDSFCRYVQDVGLGDLNIQFSHNNWPEMIMKGHVSHLDSYKYNAKLCALAQHYRLPTRLLDWTRDPLTAVYFALTDNPDAQGVSVHCLNQKEAADFISQSGEGPIEFKIWTFPHAANQYMNAQQGCFTVWTKFWYFYAEHKRFPSVVDFVERTVSARRQSNQIYQEVRINLDREKKLEAIRRLILERKTIAHLMPSFSSCADAVLAEFDFVSAQSVQRV